MICVSGCINFLYTIVSGNVGRFVQTMGWKVCNSVFISFVLLYQLITSSILYYCLLSLIQWIFSYSAAPGQSRSKDFLWFSDRPMLPSLQFLFPGTLQLENQAWFAICWRLWAFPTPISAVLNVGPRSWFLNRCWINYMVTDHAHRTTSLISQNVWTFQALLSTSKVWDVEVHQISTGHYLSTLVTLFLTTLNGSVFTIRPFFSHF